MNPILSIIRQLKATAFPHHPNTNQGGPGPNLSLEGHIRLWPFPHHLIQTRGAGGPNLRPRKANKAKTNRAPVLASAKNEALKGIMEPLEEPEARRKARRTRDR